MTIRKSWILGHRTIGLAGWDLFNPAMTASKDGDVLAFVAQTAGPSVPGVASVYGTIDGATGNHISHRAIAL